MSAILPVMIGADSSRKPGNTWEKTVPPIYAKGLVTMRSTRRLAVIYLTILMIPVSLWLIYTLVRTHEKPFVGVKSEVTEPGKFSPAF